MLELNAKLNAASGATQKGSASVSASPSAQPQQTYLQAQAANAPKPAVEVKVSQALDDAKKADAAKSAKEPSLSDRLEKASEEIQKYIPDALPNTRLSIEQDKDTNLFVYKSIDKTSGETVRQFPAEEVLKFIAFYREKEGLVVDNKV